MANYIIRRLGWVVVTLFGIVLINFFVMHLLPIDYAKVIAGTHASAVTLKEIAQNYGLDHPIWYQFILYIRQLGSLDLGYSYQLHLPVTAMLGAAIPKTFYLALAAVILELIIGIPLGIWTARRAGTFLDSLVIAISLVGVSLPTFAVGSLLLYVFAFRLPWFPLGGFAPFPHIGYVVLPALSYAITGAAYYTRLLRSAMLDIGDADYVRTAWAKGLSSNRVVLRHIFRNALIPVVTFFGLDFGGLLGGLLVTESIFDWPGIGAMTYRAIPVVDVPTLLGVVLFASFAIVMMNLLVDVFYAVLDPRISYA